MKQLSSTVIDMAHSLEAANFNLFLRSNQEKGDRLFAAFDSMHASAVTSIGDLIDASFRQAMSLTAVLQSIADDLDIPRHMPSMSINPLSWPSHM